MIKRFKDHLDPLVLICFFATVVILVILGYILYTVFNLGLERLSLEFLIEDPRDGMKAGGIFPAIFGTLALIFIMIIFVVPIGVMTAIYLNEYSQNNWLYRMIRLAINNLAGVPSIVFGLFGLGFFIHFIGGGIDNFLYGGELIYGKPAIIWSALTLALLTLPVVIVSTEEALRSVGQDMRMGSYALGATKLQTIMRVVFPQSLSGLLTGGILAIARGAGEVAPILFTGVAYYTPELPTELSHQFMDLGYHIFIMVTQSPNVDESLPILYSTILVLMILIFILNFIGVIIRLRLRSRLRKVKVS